MHGLQLINGKEKQIFKDPKTDDGIKKSQKGKVHVYKSGDKICFTDGHNLDSELSSDLLVPVFWNGLVSNIQTFAQIRERLAKK